MKQALVSLVPIHFFFAFERWQILVLTSILQPASPRCSPAYDSRKTYAVCCSVNSHFFIESCAVDWHTQLTGLLSRGLAQILGKRPTASQPVAGPICIIP